MSSQTGNFGNTNLGSVTNTESVPQLFTVPSGSYVSNASYGSFVPAMLTVDNAVLPSLSVHDIRRHDLSTSFAMKITLDLTQPSPFGNRTSDELRVRTTPIVATPKTAQGDILPGPAHGTHLPIFGDVDIVFGTGAEALNLAGELKARLLYGGELALVRANYSAGALPHTIPILTSDLVGLFGSQVPATLIIAIRGDYLTTGAIPY